MNSKFASSARPLRPQGAVMGMRARHCGERFAQVAVTLSLLIVAGNASAQCPGPNCGGGHVRIVGVGLVRTEPTLPIENAGFDLLYKITTSALFSHPVAAVFTASYNGKLLKLPDGASDMVYDLNTPNFASNPERVHIDNAPGGIAVVTLTVRNPPKCAALKPYCIGSVLASADIKINVASVQNLGAVCAEGVEVHIKKRAPGAAFCDSAEFRIKLVNRGSVNAVGSLKTYLHVGGTGIACAGYQFTNADSENWFTTASSTVYPADGSTVIEPPTAEPPADQQVITNIAYDPGAKYSVTGQVFLPSQPGADGSTCHQFQTTPSPIPPQGEQ